MTLVSLALLSEPAAAKPPRDAGPCTVSGTKRADVLRGTTRDDVICGLSGRDRIIAGAGKDILRGGGGEDLLRARDGDDTLSGGGGDDDLFGENDDDRLDGGKGADLLDPGRGDNSCRETDAGDLVVTTCWMGYRIDSLTLSPAAVDTWSSDREVEVAVEITDTREGPATLTSVAMDVVSPSAGFRSPYGEYPLRRAAGGGAQGIWRGTIKMPRYSTHGAHAISMILCESYSVHSDGSGFCDNKWHVGTSDLRAAGQPAAIQQTGPGDAGAPTPMSLEISPRVADTSTGPVEVEFLARVTDDLLGTERVTFDLASPTDPYAIATDAVRTAGTPHDGTWRGTWTFQAGGHHPPGIYQVGLYTDDGLNWLRYRPADLEARGMNPRFEVR